MNTKPHLPPEEGVSHASNVRPINSVDSEDENVSVGVDMSAEAAGKVVWYFALPFLPHPLGIELVAGQRYGWGGWLVGVY